MRRLRGAPFHNLLRSEGGSSFVETAVSLALIGSIVAAYLGAMGTSSRASAVTVERDIAISLARSQMENVKNVSYVPGATTYTAAALPTASDYAGYSVSIAAAALHSPDDGIQKITVTVNRSGQSVLTLEGYKVNR